MDLNGSQVSPNEQKRVEDLVRLIPATGDVALDVGAREGHLSRLLATKYERVVSLDLVRPEVDHPRVSCTEGDVTNLHYNDNSFDLVLCTEVLEHIQPDRLGVACDELTRVTGKHLIIGVPCQQDLRVGRTQCLDCGKRNPPYGHVNSFDERRLKSLFSTLQIERVSYVGSIKARTNFVSTAMLDWAGNPYGAYSQREPCIYCGQRLIPPTMTLARKILARCAYRLRYAQDLFSRPRPGWIHLLFTKRVKESV